MGSGLVAEKDGYSLGLEEMELRLGLPGGGGSEGDGAKHSGKRDFSETIGLKLKLQTVVDSKEVKMEGFIYIHDMHYTCACTPSVHILYVTVSNHFIPFDDILNSFSSGIKMVEMGEDCCSTQLINGDGVFNVYGIENFLKKVKLAECGLSYAVVSIMGPQSSGVFASLLSAFLFNKRKEKL